MMSYEMLTTSHDACILFYELHTLGSGLGTYTQVWYYKDSTLCGKQGENIINVYTCTCTCTYIFIYLFDRSFGRLGRLWLW